MNKVYKALMPLVFLPILSSNLSSDMTLKSDLNNNKKLEDIIIQKSSPFNLRIAVIEEGNILYEAKEEIITFPIDLEVIKYNNQDFFIYTISDGGNSGQATLVEVYFEKGKLKKYQEEVGSPKIIKEGNNYILQTLKVTDRTGSHAEWKYNTIRRNLPISKNKNSPKHRLL